MRTCAYCGLDCLSGRDDPEHAIPHALGASLTVDTVCTSCNRWASREIDQPFLRDDLVRIYRHRHDIRAPGPNRGRRVPSPLFSGKTKSGEHVRVGEDGTPHVSGQITRNAETGDYEISAPTMEVAETLVRRAEREAREQGFTVKRGPVSRTRYRPTIRVSIATHQAVWGRMTAKIALAVSSSVFAPAWRHQAMATDLRRVLRGEPSTWLGEQPHLFPETLPDELQRVLGVPNHTIYFQRASSGQVLIAVVLFGEKFLGAPVGSEKDPLPDAAWRLEPHSPRRDGKTTFEGLFLPYVEDVARNPREFGPSQE